MPVSNHQREISDSRRAKEVTFALNASKVQETLHRFDFSLDERRAYWYNEQERQESRDEATAIVKKMEKGKRLGNHICTRGLEVQTMDGMEFRRRVQKCAQNAVLKEQRRQRGVRIRKGGPTTLDEYNIAMACKKYSNKSQLEAHVRGRADQQESETAWSSRHSKTSSNGVSTSSKKHKWNFSNENDTTRHGKSPGSSPFLSRSRSLVRDLPHRWHRFMVSPASSSASARPGGRSMNNKRTTHPR